MRYEAQLCDGDGNVIESEASDDPKVIHQFLRTVGAMLIAHDGPELDGDGAFVPGELRWYATGD